MIVFRVYELFVSGIWIWKVLFIFNFFLGEIIFLGNEGYIWVCVKKEVLVLIMVLKCLVISFIKYLNCLNFGVNKWKNESK